MGKGRGSGVEFLKKGERGSVKKEKEKKRNGKIDGYCPFFYD